MNFEDSLNAQSLNERISYDLLFESFVLSKPENGYGFISLSTDMQEVVDATKFTPRFIVRSRNVMEVKRFCGIKIGITVGKLHTVVSRLQHEDNKLILSVHGHTEYENLKKLIKVFTYKNPEIVIDMTLEQAKDGVYVYPELKYIGFWSILKGLFLKETLFEF